MVLPAPSHDDLLLDPEKGDTLFMRKISQSAEDGVLVKCDPPSRPLQTYTPPPNAVVDHPATATTAIPDVKIQNISAFLMCLIACLTFDYFVRFSQSARNCFMPISVNGCLASWLITFNGIVAISAPIRAASIICIGLRTLATITSLW